MKGIKEVLFKGFQGMVIGIFLIYTIGFICMLLARQPQSIEPIFLKKQYIAAGGIGFVFGILNLLFQIDKLGIIKATVSHFIGICIIFFPMAYYAGWIGKDAMTIIESIIILIISYFLIWFICYLGWKKEINNINKKLSNRGHKCFDDQ
ncbi:MAG: DUF3021 domain-containing protein [Cellulosilyticaceae bacterium]